MANQYGTKAWAIWAYRNLEFSLHLLKEPDKQWDKETTYGENAIKSLSSIEKGLEEIITK